MPIENIDKLVLSINNHFKKSGTAGHLRLMEINKYPTENMYKFTLDDYSKISIAVKEEKAYTIYAHWSGKITIVRAINQVIPFIATLNHTKGKKIYYKYLMSLLEMTTNIEDVGMVDKMIDMALVTITKTPTQIDITISKRK